MSIIAPSGSSVGIRRRHCRGHRPDTAAILASNAFAVTSVYTESGGMGDFALTSVAVGRLFPLLETCLLLCRLNPRCSSSDVVLILHKEITADTVTVLLEDTMAVHVQ